MLGLAQAQLGLKNDRPARGWLLRYKSRNPLNPRAYHLLGDISAREKDVSQAAQFYKDALRLGGGLPAKREMLKLQRRIERLAGRGGIAHE